MNTHTSTGSNMTTDTSTNPTQPISAHRDDPPLKIITLNIKGLRNKTNQIKNLIRHFRPDFLLLQETNINTTKMKRWTELKLQPVAKEFFWTFDKHENHCRGVAIIRTSDNWTAKEHYFDQDGRIGKICIQKEHTEYNLYNIYAPAGNTHHNFFETLGKTIQLGTKTIIGGDFNATLDGYDRSSPDGQLTATKTRQLKQLIRTFDLHDPYRTSNPLGRETTFTSNLGHKTRIDRFLVTKGILTPNTEHIEDTREYTDHSAVFGTFGHEISKHNHKSPYWKFNNTLLNNKTYTDRIISIILDYTNNTPQQDIQEWWDTLKNTIKYTTIYFGKILKRQMNQQEKEYKEILNILKAGENNDEYIADIKGKLNSIEQTRLNGHLTRCRQATGLDSINTKELKDTIKHIETSTQKSRKITKIRDKDGNMTTDKEGIAQTFFDFYKRLYQHEATDIDMLNKYSEYAQPLHEDDKITIDQEISITDIENTIQTMNNGKSPGPDGLTVEFYKFFSPLLKNTLHKLFMAIHHTGKLCPSQNKSYITLIPKKDADHSLAKNFRPISLLNTDYKIITKTLANKIKPFLHTIIKSDQTCSIPGRTIEQNTHFIRDIIYYTKSTRNPAYILSIDQEKAFDRLAHNYIHKVLEKSNLGEYYRKWVKIIYSEPESCIIVNQEISEPFEIGKSVRQGCPLSAILYTLCLETFLESARKNPLIKGTKIPGYPNKKLVAYADDTTFFPANRKSIREIITNFREYGLGSGAKINVGKSKIMGIGGGTFDGKEINNLGLESVDSIKILGIEYNKTNKLPEAFWNRLLNKAERLVHKFNTLHTNIFDRAAITNTYITPVVFYTAKVHNPPSKFIQHFRTIIFRYILQTTNKQISYQSLSLPTQLGGAGLHDIRDKLDTAKIKLIDTILEKPNDYPFTNYYLGTKLIKFQKLDHTVPHFGGQSLPPFYKPYGDLIKNNPEIIGKGLESRKMLHHLAQKHTQHIPYETSITPQRLKVAAENIHNYNIRPQAKDITFKFIFDILPTQRNHICHLCKNHVENETRHLITKCKTLGPLIQEIMQQLQNSTEKHVHAEYALRSNLIPYTNHAQHTKNLQLLAETRLTIWTLRNTAKDTPHQPHMTEINNILQNYLYLASTYDKDVRSTATLDVS